MGNNSVDIKALSAVGNVGDGRNADSVGISIAVKSEDSWVNATNNLLIGYSSGGIVVTKGHNVNVANNLIAGVGGVGIKTSGYSNHNITGNVVRYAGGVGIDIQSKMSPVTVSDNQVRFCDAQGILVNQTKEDSPIGGSVNGNILHSNDEAGNGVPEIDVKSENILAVGNHIGTRGGSASFSDSGTGNLWVGNMAPADGGVWSLDSATSVQTMANRPNPAGKGFVLASPNGTEYEITVADDGTLNTTQL